MGLRLTIWVSDIQPKLNETVNLSVTLDDLSNSEIQPQNVVGGSIEVKNQTGQVVWKSIGSPGIPALNNSTALPSTSGSSPDIPATPVLWRLNVTKSWVVITDSGIGIAVNPGKYYLSVIENFYPGAADQQTESISIQPLEITVRQ